MRTTRPTLEEAIAVRDLMLEGLYVKKTPAERQAEMTQRMRDDFVFFIFVLWKL
ncbi:hypothetical protein [Enterobacter phage 02_vB_Eclo_IJM]|nr:hypothetical protein [Enterobacter phage 02_vB_Eclo_IJM]